jgi:hypothetical protein
VHIIGIGNEVKELLKMAASHPMTVAHVPQRATASQVATVVGAAISIVRDTAVTTADFSTAEEHATATNARIITVDNLCGQPAAAAEQVQAIESDASRVYVGDDAFTVETFKEAFAKAEDAAPIAECAKKYTRGAVMWLLTLSLAQGKVPGAVIGGRFAKVFKPSEGAGDNWKVNKLLSELKKTGIVTAKKEEKIELVVEGHSRMFTKVVCYEASPQAAHLVVQMTEKTPSGPPRKRSLCGWATSARASTASPPRGHRSRESVRATSELPPSTTSGRRPRRSRARSAARRRARRPPLPPRTRSQKMDRVCNNRCPRI